MEEACVDKLGGHLIGAVATCIAVGDVATAAVDSVAGFDRMYAGSGAD